MTRVAILINNYNNGPWVRACVDSALDQTRPADEIIVYDDGSTDDSPAILRSYGDRIRLIEGIHDHSRSGRASAAHAIAAAFAASTADHLYLLDGDDAYLPAHLADYEAAWAERPDAVMIQGPMRKIDAHGRDIGLFHEPRKHRLDYLSAIYRHHQTDYFYITSALAFRRDFLARVLPRVRADGVDAPADLYLTLHAVFSGPVLAVPAPTARYRIRPGSLAERNGLRGGRRVHDTRMRVACFNAIAAHYGRPPVRLWRDPTYLQQLARLWLPDWLTLPFARLKVALRR